MAESHRLAAVIPVLDEAEAIGPLVRDTLASGACCVFVVDSGSRDGTPEIARRQGAVVVIEPRRGYGRACLTGARVACQTGHRAIAFLDGDGSCDPYDLPALVQALGDVTGADGSGADVVLGRRTARGIERGALPWHARAGNSLVAAIITARGRRRIHDLPPSKVFRAAVLERLALDDPGYGWTVQAIARALSDPSIRVVEHPVRFRRRQGGTSKVSGSWRASVAAGRAMLRVAWQETKARPMLALMAKAPGDGHAKTRLARDIGAPLTRSLWSACLADGGTSMRRAAARLGLAPVAFVPSTADRVALADILRGWRVQVQRRDGLSGALVDAFVEAFDAGASWAIAVSADSPTLPHELIAAATEALSTEARAVLGPCPDGGYHLVGLRWHRRLPLVGVWQRRRLVGRLERAFGAVPMGGSDAFSATHEALHHQGWQVRTLRTWSDLDVGGDLRELAGAVSDDPDRFPHLGSWFGQHRDVVRRWADTGPTS